MEDKVDKMSKSFHITSLCRSDIIQAIEDGNFGDKIRKLMFIKGVENITDDEMERLASKLRDHFCNCCFWESLEHEFLELIEWKMRK